MNSIGTGGMLCGYCGRPAFSLVYIGGVGYHLECTRSPAYQEQVYQSSPQPHWFGLTEDRVREIVRDELKARETS